MEKLRYSFLRRTINFCKKPIVMHWYKDDVAKIYNFGDELSRIIIRRLFGYRVKWAEMKDCEFVALGSMLNHAEEAISKPIQFWGTGFIKKPKTCKKLKQCKFAAVRGKLSAECLGLEDITMGDPGILTNLIFPASKKRSEKIGVVVHYVDLEEEVVDKIRQDERFMVISALQSPKEVARQISSCRAIISSSLHGLILADSYDVPNIHVAFSDKVIGGEFKFRDYCSGVGKKYQKISQAKIFDDESIEKFIKEYVPIKNKQEIQAKLVESFPQNFRDGEIS